jgi:hypothetical protein
MKKIIIHFLKINVAQQTVFIFLLMQFFLFDLHAQDNMKAIISQSNFIFRGTIIRMDASNIDAVADVPTAVVRVDEVVDAVEPYEQMKGKDITVLLSSSRGKKAGDKQIFYTSGWYYGKTLGVKETENNLRNTDNADALKKKVAVERINIRNDSIASELKRAVAVITGVVVETNINVEKTPFIESEHDPELRKAIIEVKQVLKGRISAQRIEVFYAASDDVIWYSAPKLSKGLQAIFLLQMRQAPAIYRIKGFTVLDRRDVQSIENLETIKILLRNNL